MATTSKRHMYNEGLGDIARAVRWWMSARSRLEASGIADWIRDEHWEEHTRLVASMQALSRSIEDAEHRHREFVRKVESGVSLDDTPSPTPADRARQDATDTVTREQLQDQLDRMIRSRRTA